MSGRSMPQRVFSDTCNNDFTLKTGLIALFISCQLLQTGHTGKILTGLHAVGG